MPAPGSLVMWEEKLLLAGPYRKDWQPRKRPAPPCVVLYYLPNDRCLECFPGCGLHKRGCVFTSDMGAYGNLAHELRMGGKEAAYHQWLVAEHCPEYHGE